MAQSHMSFLDVQLFSFAHVYQRIPVVRLSMVWRLKVQMALNHRKMCLLSHTITLIWWQSRTLGYYSTLFCEEWHKGFSLAFFECVKHKPDSRTCQGKTLSWQRNLLKTRKFSGSPGTESRSTAQFHFISVDSYRFTRFINNNKITIP